MPFFLPRHRVFQERGEAAGRSQLRHVCDSRTSFAKAAPRAASPTASAATSTESTDQESGLVTRDSRWRSTSVLASTWPRASARAVFLNPVNPVSVTSCGVYPAKRKPGACDGTSLSAFSLHSAGAPLQTAERGTCRPRTAGELRLTLPGGAMFEVDHSSSNVQRAFLENTFTFAFTW